MRLLIANNAGFAALLKKEKIMKKILKSLAYLL